MRIPLRPLCHFSDLEPFIRVPGWPPLSEHMRPTLLHVQKHQNGNIEF